MEKEREKHLKKVKALYFCTNLFFVALMMFIAAFFKKLHLNMTVAISLCLLIMIFLYIFNMESKVEGIENISNRDLTRILLSDKSFVEVIPKLLTSSDDKLKNEGTYNRTFGNIHNNLVKSGADSRFFAKLSNYNPSGKIEKVEIYRHFEGEGTTFIGYVKPEYFPYFYELKELKMKK